MKRLGLVFVILALLVALVPSVAPARSAGEFHFDDLSASPIEFVFSHNASGADYYIVSYDAEWPIVGIMLDIVTSVTDTFRAHAAPRLWGGNFGVPSLNTCIHSNTIDGNPPGTNCWGYAVGYTGFGGNAVSGVGVHSGYITVPTGEAWAGEIVGVIMYETYPTATPTATSTPTATDTPTETPTPTETLTPTPGPTDTPTETPVATDTETPVPGPTDTPEPPTPTPTPDLDSIDSTDFIFIPVLVIFAVIISIWTSRVLYLLLGYLIILVGQLGVYFYDCAFVQGVYSSCVPLALVADQLQENFIALTAAFVIVSLFVEVLSWLFGGNK